MNQQSSRFRGQHRERRASTLRPIWTHMPAAERVTDSARLANQQRTRTEWSRGRNTFTTGVIQQEAGGRVGEDGLRIQMK